MNGVWQLLLAGLGGGGLAGFLGSLLTGWWQRPKVRADAVALLTDSALKQVNELQERTAEAEREATAARAEVVQARQQIRVLTSEIDMAVMTIRSWRSTILATPDVPEAIRRMVLVDPGSANGRPVG